MTSGIAAFTDGYFGGRERLRQHKREDEQDQWNRRTREREEVDWAHEDGEREYQQGEREYQQGRRAKTDAHADQRMAAEGVGYQDTIEHGAQDASDEREYQQTARDLDLTGKRAGISATRQSMADSRASNARAAESHEWRRAREGAVARQLEAGEKYMRAVAKFAPLLDSDPAAAGTKIAEIVNQSGVNGRAKLGVGYNPETGLFSTSLFRNGKKIKGDRISAEELMNRAHVALDPVGFGGEWTQKAAESAKRYQDTADDRVKWERELMAELAKTPPYEIPIAADADRDGKVTQAELAAYVKLLGNNLFENTPRFLPRAPQDAAGARAGVSGAQEPVAQGALQPGTVVDGYRYKGGDPNSESSWEQV